MLWWTTANSLTNTQCFVRRASCHLSLLIFYGFPVVMYGYDSRTIKKAERWRIDAFELWCWRRTLESPLDCKEIQPVHLKGDQSWIFIGRTDAEAETPILWPPDKKNWLTGKRPWCCERLKAGGDRDDRGWDGWMASPTLWMWVWVNSRS